MLQYSAEGFRQRLAGLESPETKFTSQELEDMKAVGVALIKSLRDVFGDSLDRKTLWERISNGIYVSAAKSGNKTDAFIAALLEYVKAGANSVVGSDSLRSVTKAITGLTPEAQKQFINTCVKYRMLLCLQARDDVQANRALKDQTGAKTVEVTPDGEVIAKGVS